MKKGLKLFLLLLGSVAVNAQIGIGTDDPKASLEIKATNTTTTPNGILIPRLDRLQVSQMQNVEESTLIYVNNVTTGSATGNVQYVDTPGFYYFQDGYWVNLPNKLEVDKNVFWKEQSETSGNTSPRSQQDPSDTTSIVYKDIYQKGKVGIGYNSSGDINTNFDVNKSPKQLDVLGDFRTLKYQTGLTRTDIFGNVRNLEPQYFGFETNSKALPAHLAVTGNVMYSSVSKNLEDYSYFDRSFEGNMLLQTSDELIYLSRTGKSSTGGAFAHELQMNSIGSNEFVYKAQTDSTHYSYLKSFNSLGFSVVDFDDNDNGFGINFSKKRFYIGDNNTNGTGYYFPNTQGNTGQILKLNANRELEWSNTTDAIVPGEKDQILTTTETSAVDGEGNTTTTKTIEWRDPENIYTSPKFFYMPSVLLPTSATSQVIDFRVKNPNYQGTGPDEFLTVQNYTYNSTSQVYTVDLYSIFKSQFQLPIASSNATSTLENFVLTADKYDYFITYADTNVFETISVNADGKLTYKVKADVIVRNGSFMNAVIKVK